MTEPGGPRERDDVYFGPGGAAGDQHPSGLPPDAASRHSVDAWFSEESEAARLAGPLDSALAAMDRHRTSALAGLGAITVIALVVAALGWAREGPSTAHEAPLGTGESHGLTPDQAACFGFGRIEGRVKAVLGAEGRIGAGPVRPYFGSEITSLDGLGAAYPSADYRLIVAFADVADASLRMSGERDPGNYRPLVVERATDVRKVRDVCREIASFDIDTSSPLDSGH